MPFSGCSIGKVVMADRVWSFWLTRQAATASRPAVNGSLEAMARLSATNWRDSAMESCREALAASDTAIAAAVTAITVRARPAITPRRRQVLRRAARWAAPRNALLVGR